MKLLYYLLPVLIFQDCKAQPVPKYAYNKDDNSLLWEISGKGIKPSYLFGTFHLMCKEDIKLSANLRQAVKNADQLYFEMDLDDMSNMIAALKFMKMKNDTTLKDLYSPAEYSKVQSFFQDSLQMPMMMVQTMKPLMLEALLYPKMMPCKTMTGVEEEIMQLAKPDKKEIKGFETLEFQASVFDSIPYTVQADALLKSIDSLSEGKAEFDSMLNIYKAQQLSEIEKMFLKSEFGEGESREILLDNRNKNWVKQLKQILNDKSYFIAVGAAHLVGEKGLISLLRKEGYTLKPIEN